MSLTAPISRAVDVIRGQPVVVVPFAAFIVLTTILALGSVLGPAAAAGFGIIDFIVSIVGGVLLAGMYIDMARQGARGKVSLNAAWEVAVSRFWQLLLLEIIIAVIFIVIALVIAAGSGVFSQLSTLLPLITSNTLANQSSISTLAPVLARLGEFLVLLIIVMVVVSIFLYQANVVVVLEKRSATDALNRSIEIGKKNFFSILLFFILIFILSLIFFIIFGLLSRIPIIGVVILLVAEMFFSAWVAMLPTMFYFEYAAPAARKTGKSGK